MAGLFNILKVTVSEDKICAHVLVNPGMPLMTSEDIEATARVYYLVPAIAKHLCLGDSGREFQDCMGQTELCHLLEHVTVELMNETGLAGSISCGRTRVSEHDERVFEVELSCPDDALAIGALSSATFMMDWAYLHADQPAPDVEGTVAGLRNLVLGMRAEAEGKDPHEAVAAANGEDTAEDEGADEGDVPADAEPVADATAEPSRSPPSPRASPTLTTSPRWRLIPRARLPRTTRPPLPSLAVRRRFQQDLRMRAVCRSWTAPARTRVPRWPCRLCRRSRPTRLSPSRTCAFAVRR